MRWSMQSYSFSHKYVRVRMRRFFEGQYKHVYIGRVIAENQELPDLAGVPFTFERSVHGAIAGERLSEANGLHTEPASERAIPGLRSNSLKSSREA